MAVGSGQLKVGCGQLAGVRAVDLVVQGLPPVHDAIGEYTACLARELSQSLEIRVLTSRDQSVEPLQNAVIDSCFSLQDSRRFDGLLRSLIKTDADAVVLQYNPFAWGSRGWAPDLVNAIRSFKAARPDVVLAVMFHETFMMNPGFRSWLMRLYQRRQFENLCSASDISFFSTELWTQQCRKAHPDLNAFHLPVGANLPVSTHDHSATRQQWQIQQNDFVCGVFGGAHPSRMLPWIERAIEQIAQRCHPKQQVVLLHVGGEPIHWTVPNVHVVSTGRLPAKEATDAVAIMDLMINPFSDGISTRRGSAMAALQNGVPVLTTRGHATDSLWERQVDQAVFLSSPRSVLDWDEATQRAWQASKQRNPASQKQIKDFYCENFSWSVIGQALRDHLSAAKKALTC